MKPLATALVLIVLLCSPLIPLASAQTNHNLQWGVQVGDEIILVLQRKLVDPAVAQYLVEYAPIMMNISEGQRVIANVTFLSPIPSHINSSEQIPLSNCTLTRENDSVVVARDLGMIVLPVGDYDFLTQIGNYTGGEGMSIIDDEEEWGTIMDRSFVIFLFTVTIHFEMRYLKANGTLSLMEANVNLSGNDIIDIIFVRWRPGMTTVLPGGLQLLTIEISAIALFVIAGVVLLVWRRRQHVSLAETPVLP